MKKSGFTLLELIIAITIMAFLSLFTSQTISRAIHTKEKVQKTIDKYSTLRDALRVIERDINLAYNYQDFNAKLFNLSLKERAARAQSSATPAATPANPANPATPPTPPTTPANPNTPAFKEHFEQKKEFNYCAFVGSKDAMDFTSLANVRMTENQQISQQAEIGYHLKSCRRRTQQSGSTTCLWRRVAPVIDDDPIKGGEETVLLENVTKFELRYLGPGKQDEWIDTWITTERGDALTKGKFPYAVEVTIEVQDKSNDSKDKPLRMTTVAALRNPNNPPPADPNNPDAPTDPNAAPGGIPPGGLPVQPPPNQGNPTRAGG